MNPRDFHHHPRTFRARCYAILDAPFVESEGHRQLMRGYRITSTYSAFCKGAQQDTLAAILHADAEAIRMEMTAGGGEAL